jgi:hypothetical protein
MARYERYAFACLSVFFVTIIAIFYSKTAMAKHLDSVFLYEVLQNLADRWQPVSATVASWSPVVKTFSAPIEDVCRMALGFPTPNEYNVIDNHAYFFLYPMALFAKLLNAETVFSVFTAISYTVLLLLPYWFLRRVGVKPIAAAVFSLCVLCYPGLSQGALGDFYLDRLYMPFSLGLLCLLHIARTDTQSKYLAWLIALLAIFAAICTERAAIMVIASLSFFIIFFPDFRKNKIILYLSVSLIVGVVLYLIWYFEFVYSPIDNLLGSINLSPNSLWLRLQTPGAIPFILTNLLFLGWMVFFAGWRYALLMLGALFPNVAISIGGAEFNGWVTHYHSMYIPFLIFISSVGFIRLQKYCAAFGYERSATLGIAVLTLILGAKFNPEKATWESGGGLRNSFGLTSAVFRYYFKPNHSDAGVMAYWLQGLPDMIPVGAKVSSTDGVMPSLYRDRDLAIYPFGIDEADYLVIGGNVIDGVPQNVSGAISYLDSLGLNNCINKRTAKQGFVFYKDIPAVGVVVYKRALTK